MYPGGSGSWEPEGYCFCGPVGVPSARDSSCFLSPDAGTGAHSAPHSLLGPTCAPAQACCIPPGCPDLSFEAINIRGQLEVFRGLPGLLWWPSDTVTDSDTQGATVGGGLSALLALPHPYQAADVRGPLTLSHPRGLSQLMLNSVSILTHFLWGTVRGGGLG